MDYFDGLSLKEHKKGIERQRNQMGRKNSPELRLCCMRKMDELSEVLQVKGARLCKEGMKTRRLQYTRSKDKN